MSAVIVHILKTVYSSSHGLSEDDVEFIKIVELPMPPFPGLRITFNESVEEVDYVEIIDSAINVVLKSDRPTSILYPNEIKPIAMFWTRRGFKKVKY